MSSKRLSTKARSYVEALLVGFGYIKVARKIHIVDVKHFFSIQPAAKSKNISFVFLSREIVVKIITPLLTELGIKVDLDQKDMPSFKVNVAAIMEMANKKPNPEKAVTMDNQAATGMPEKSIEQTIIEKVLDGKCIQYSANLPKGDSDLYLSFDNEEQFLLAQDLLDVNAVDFVAGENEMDMYVSLALPDALLNGIIDNETPAQKKDRHYSELAKRAKFILEKNYEYVIQEPNGKKPLKVNHVRIAGEGAFRRIDFANLTEKTWFNKLLKM